jgi:uncharacterized membrane protein
MGWSTRQSVWVTNHISRLRVPLTKAGAYQGDSHARSIAKAISYRVGGLIVTILVVWALSGKVELAAAAGFTDTFLKVGLYYFHERVWNRTNFGLKPQ